MKSSDNPKAPEQLQIINKRVYPEQCHLFMFVLPSELWNSRGGSTQPREHGSPTAISLHLIQCLYHLKEDSTCKYHSKFCGHCSILTDPGTKIHRCPSFLEEMVSYCALWSRWSIKPSVNCCHMVPRGEWEEKKVVPVWYNFFPKYFPSIVSWIHKAECQTPKANYMAPKKDLLWLCYYDANERYWPEEEKALSVVLCWARGLPTNSKNLTLPPNFCRVPSNFILSYVLYKSTSYK